MKKKKLELRSLEVKSFITHGQDFKKDTIKGAGVLSFFEPSCVFGKACNQTNNCTITCANTCTCYTNCGGCPSDYPCATTQPEDTVCICQ